jgi:hypothetical protein
VVEEAVACQLAAVVDEAVANQLTSVVAEAGVYQLAAVVEEAVACQLAAVVEEAAVDSMADVEGGVREGVEDTNLQNKRFSQAVLAFPIPYQCKFCNSSGFNPNVHQPI